MTDLDDLLAEVAIRTDRSHHWTGKHQLTISDPDLAKELAAALRGLRGRPCPHIETGDDGTSHCTLAESANTAWAARWQEQFDRAERIKKALQGCWDEYQELMPERLYDRVREALALRVFTAATPDRPRRPSDSSTSW